jgi:hypothetical protein
VTGLAGIPARGVAAVTLNVTGTQATAGTVVTVVAGTAGVPATSNFNLTAGQTAANLVLAPVGADGQVDLAVTSGATHLVADVTGYVLGPPADTTPPSAVTGLTATTTASAIRLTWVNPTDPDLGGAIIRRAAGAAAPSTIAEGHPVGTAGAGTTTWVDSTVAPGVTYSYAVFPFDQTPNVGSPTSASAATTGLSWTPPAAADPEQGGPVDVSCPTSSWCTAVDDSGQAFVYAAGTWRPPVQVVTTDGVSLATAFRAVSCPSTTFCLAVLGGRRIATYASGVWTVMPRVCSGRRWTATARPVADWDPAATGTTPSLPTSATGTARRSGR